MNLNFNKFYNPIQPSVKGEEDFASYFEVFPEQNLGSFIYCYWFLKTNNNLQSPLTYNVVADGCIDIVFDLNDPSINYLMGFCNQNNEFEIDKSFNSVGIRFLPSMFPILFKVDASELYNTLAPLNLFLKATSNFIENNFDFKDNHLSIKNKLDNYFLDVLKNTTLKLDYRFLESVDFILRNNGVLNINNDLDYGLSQRQLRRYFDIYIGTSPKSFSQVIRFQNFLNAKPSLQSIKANKLYYDFGYYDQAHFINEFKKYYGLTPTKSLK